MAFIPPLGINNQIRENLNGSLAIPSTFHTYSVMTEYIKNWFLNRFGSNPFKHIHIENKHVYDDMRGFNIPDVMKYVNNTWVMVDNPQDCEARLESIEDYFKGDFSELKDVISYQPSNKVKVLFGVRTTDDNKQYQTVYTSMFLKNHVRDYSRLDQDLQERKQQGAFANTEFIVDDLKEYKVDSTDLSQSGTGALPFPGATDSAPSPWDLSK